MRIFERNLVGGIVTSFHQQGYYVGSYYAQHMQNVHSWGYNVNFAQYFTRAAFLLWRNYSTQHLSSLLPGHTR
jgi:hypothetical protein